MTTPIGKGQVLVTGANGFVGSHIVALLLSKGYTVHATVRRQQAADDLLSTFTSDQFRVFVIPDLTAPNALDKAIAYCKFVVHVASTVPTKDATLGISIESTVGSIESVMKTASSFHCSKVVLTSSMSTHLDTHAAILDESTWYTPDLTSTKLFVQYMSAKTLAEKRAWGLSTTLQMPLTTIAPVYIGGPTIMKGQDPKSPSSNQDLLRCIEDESKSKIPGWIDVRTVAHLHLLAIEAELDGRRILACTHDRGLVKMDVSLMTKLLARAPEAKIGYDETKRDLLSQIQYFDSRGQGVVV